MKRVNLFLIVLVASLTALIALTAIGFAIFTSTQSSQQSNNWLGQMMGGMSGMMGQTQTGATQTSTNPLLTYFGVLFVAFIGTTIVGIAGLAYYLLYPQIRVGAVQPTVQNADQQQNLNGNSPYESVSKTLTEEERKIIDVLNAHNGKYLQKYIRKETGLSRLKTHRTIARLAERGIVSLEKTGNTNQVFLANWLQQQNNAH
jgi:uncharacterized membrane protein